MALELGEMSAFYKVTLGLPIRLNRESPEGLTAIPGIGPRTAEAIVRERTKTGGFKRIEDLRSVPGVGPALRQTIKPWVVLDDTLASPALAPEAVWPSDREGGPATSGPASYSAPPIPPPRGAVTDRSETQ